MTLRQACVFLTLVFLNPIISQAAPSMIRILMDSPPLTLNPRMTQDATGQRLTALLFPALTRQNSKLEVEGDLASSFSASPDLKTWRFQLRTGVLDHGGLPIDSSVLKECFTRYRESPPLALSIQALQPWKSLRAAGATLTFELENADPYFARNITVLRYFRQEGAPPCENPASEKPLIGAGEFKAEVFVTPPLQDLVVSRIQPDGSFIPRAQILFVRDENTRTIRMLRGEADVAQNVFHPSRFKWLAKTHAQNFELIEASGVNVSYLSFNMRHAALSQRKVRQALALAVPVEALMKGKFSGMVERASSFLSPLLRDSFQPEIERENPALAERLLDEAGFRRDQKGIRLTLHFKTTPYREGLEPARVLQDAFSKIGVKIHLQILEPAVFLASIRKGAYELALGRWVGIADPSILERTLRSSSPNNRAGISDPDLDGLLKRRLWREVQIKMAQELPYFPLWYWKNAVLLRKGLKGIRSEQISLSGGLRPLLEIVKE